jgi:hypothetical protein
MGANAAPIEVDALAQVVCEFVAVAVAAAAVTGGAGSLSSGTCRAVGASLRAIGFARRALQPRQHGSLFALQRFGKHALQ